MTPKFDVTTPRPKRPEEHIDTRFGTQGSNVPTGSGPSSSNASSGPSDDSNVIPNESDSDIGGPQQSQQGQQSGGGSSEPPQPSQASGQQGPSQPSSAAGQSGPSGSSGPTSTGGTSSPDDIGNRFSSNGSPVPSAEQMKQMLGDLLYKFNYTVGYHGHK